MTSSNSHCVHDFVHEYAIAEVMYSLHRHGIVECLQLQRAESTNKAKIYYVENEMYIVQPIITPHGTRAGKCVPVNSSNC